MRYQYYCASSLDGYIADDDDGLEWLTGYSPVEPPPEGERDSSYDDFYAGVGALVMGSATYEWVLEHAGEWTAFEDKPTWVLSTRELPLPDGEHEIRVAAAKPPELRADLERAVAGKHVWIVGGGPVASQFAAAGMLDDVIVTVVPVVLGSGKPLFGAALEGGPLRLAGVKPQPSGMVELRYEIVR